MKYKILCGCVVLGRSMATSSAQTKSEFSGKCGKTFNKVFLQVIRTAMCL